MSRRTERAWSRTRVPRCSARLLTGSGSPASCRRRWRPCASGVGVTIQAGGFGVSRGCSPTGAIAWLTFERSPVRGRCSGLALAQLPVEVVSDLDNEIVMRIDSAGAAGALCQAAQDANIAFLVGFDLFTGVRESILQLPESAWRPALRQDGQERDGAQIAEITHIERLDLTPWPEGSRVIIRRERPHPGAQLKFTDADGHRFQATLTDLTGDMVEIERLHRGRGDAENLIRAAKQTGLENLPFREFALNAVWLELSLIAQDLIAWTQALCLTGELAICEPKALRYRLLQPARLVSFHSPRAVLRPPAYWPHV